MRILGRITTALLVLLTAGLMLAGCGSRGTLERLKEAQTETYTIDLLAIEQQNAMPAPGSGTQAQQTAACDVPTETPKSTGATDSSTGTGTDWITMVNDLESALDELEDAIAGADQDALTDSALIALGK